MVRALFASVAVSLIAGCVAESAGEIDQQDLLPADAWVSDAELSGCPQEQCRVDEPVTIPDVPPTDQGDDHDMSNESDTGDPENTIGDLLPDGTQVPIETQIPVDSKLRFLDPRTSTPLLHVAVTGSNPPPNFAAKVEYWSRLSPLKTPTLTMESFGFTNRPGAPGYPAEFQSWLAGGSVIATAQEVTSQQWSKGVYVPESPNSALYWAVDPDQPSTHRIGLLVERGSADELLSMTWYKMTQPQNGLIFQKVPTKLTFTQVFSGDDPSIDPRLINPQATWYHYHCITR
ncbi:hypothetical protein [Sorangium sp. So ce406]|uniref:hypothetical protein n=1 Tax=Sorangium sp. So ce406 TaxID=3133311 RepID=UPI003F5C18F6